MRYRDIKPDAGAVTLRRSAFTRDLACLLLLNEKSNYPRNLVTGEAFDNNVVADVPVRPDWFYSRGGVAISGTNARGAGLNLAAYRSATAVTAFLVIDDQLNLGSNLLPVFGAFDGQATDYSNWILHIDDGSLVFNGFVLRSGPTATNATVSNLRATVGAGLHVYAFVGYNSGANVNWDVWADGIYRTTATATGSQLGSSNTSIVPQWHAAASSPKFVAMGFFHRNLSASELAAFTLRPAAVYNALLAPRQRPRIVVAAATVYGYAYPIADIAANGWTPSAGTDLYAMLDEPTTADHGDYIYSPDNPSTQEFEVLLAPQLPTGINLGLKAVGLDTTFTMKLVEGATLIEQWTESVTVAEGNVVRAHTFNPSNIATITDPSNLRIRGKASA